MNRLDAIRAREAAATKGPWETFDFDGAQLLVVPEGRRGHYIANTTSDRRVSDAAFIAHAREDIPLLLALADAVGEVMAYEKEGVGPAWWNVVTAMRALGISPLEEK